MQASRDRLRREVEMRNRSAWNTAALTGAAFAGKLRRFEEYFADRGARVSEPQTQAQMEAALQLLAAAWGAEAAGPE
ncbi:hypothetical protein RGQ15_13625 [Paracoccus sp. MBLB3053]|uniref:Uncharacterized protein n=1 Tax=Paracoccus aurantius TaxID=3073814 RepID=A0ABU2HWD7_9RHOB|nr:hypothetical protein [Paracoccus sp. MBLB3053]MDS9468604.1 hypothetical protein [Paracoccus sp. MBLB3053]